MRLLPSRKFVRRLIAASWIAIYVWLLVRTLVLRSASAKVFGDAEEVELLSIAGLSAPTSWLIALAIRWISFSWWTYRE